MKDRELREFLKECREDKILGATGMATAYFDGKESVLRALEKLLPMEASENLRAMNEGILKNLKNLKNMREQDSEIQEELRETARKMTEPSIPECIAAFKRLDDTLDRFKADIVDCIDFDKLADEMKRRR